MIRAVLVIVLFCLTASAPAFAASSRAGLVSWVQGAGSDYLALPVGRGVTVERYRKEHLR